MECFNYVLAFYHYTYVRTTWLAGWKEHQIQTGCLVSEPYIVDLGVNKYEATNLPWFRCLRPFQSMPILLKDPFHYRSTASLSTKQEIPHQPQAMANKVYLSRPKKTERTQNKWAGMGLKPLSPYTPSSGYLTIILTYRKTLSCKLSWKFYS